MGSTEHFGCLKVRTQCETTPIQVQIHSLTEEANGPISSGPLIVYAFCQQGLYTGCSQTDLDPVNDYNKTVVSEFSACYLCDPFTHSSPHCEK